MGHEKAREPEAPEGWHPLSPGLSEKPYMWEGLEEGEIRPILPAGHTGPEPGQSLKFRHQQGGLGDGGRVLRG